MADADFQHIRMSMVKDVAVVEVRTKEVHGTKPGAGAAAPRPACW